MSAEYQPNLSFVSQIPAEFLKLCEYSANPDISWIFLSASQDLKKNSAEGSANSAQTIHHETSILHTKPNFNTSAYCIMITTTISSRKPTKKTLHWT